MAVGGVACGARDDPLGPEDLAPAEPSAPPPAASSSGTGAPSLSCILCEGLVECGHCYIQGEENTFRCPPGISLMVEGCMNLDEWHRDPSGALYTCYYCR